jgi:hypothetical protein
MKTVPAWASFALRTAIRAGRIERPATCSECGFAGRTHGHHDDYAKPLVVRWLCPKCHQYWHKHNQAANQEKRMTGTSRESHAERQCAYTPCGKPFTPRNAWQRFCSTPCRWADWDRAHPRLRRPDSPPKDAA